MTWNHGGTVLRNSFVCTCWGHKCLVYFSAILLFLFYIVRVRQPSNDVRASTEQA